MLTVGSERLVGVPGGEHIVQRLTFELFIFCSKIKMETRWDRSPVSLIRIDLKGQESFRPSYPAI